MELIFDFQSLNYKAVKTVHPLDPVYATIKSLIELEPLLFKYEITAVKYQNKTIKPTIKYINLIGESNEIQIVGTCHDGASDKK